MVNKRVSTARLAELGVLSATLVHELRQPVFAIKAAAQLAKAEGGDNARLDTILGQIEHMETLLEMFGVFGGRQGKDGLFDLNVQVRKALEMVAQRRLDVGARIELDLSDESLWVRGRQVAARQVAVNLLQNALDAVEGLDVRGVTIRTARHGDAVHLEVQDTGPGVPEEIKDHLFDPFVTTKSSGAGLGLYIAWKLVQDADGELVVARVEGGGTQAVVSLPTVG